MHPRRQVWQAIAANRDRRALRAVARAGERFLDAYEARSNFLIELDGELRILRALGRRGPATLLDVGANVGEWALAAAGCYPDATIHAFEPVRSTHEQLVEATAALGTRIVTTPRALGAEPEERSIGVPEPGSDQSSLLSTTGPTETIQITTGDRYCLEAGIDHIDLLKIDTEGWDHAVLQGFHGQLEAGSIDVVQFEYGPWALETRFLLKDFYELLEDAGMVVGKVYPTSVGFGPHTVRLEDFRGLNFLAVRRSRPDLVDLVR